MWYAPCWLVFIRCSTTWEYCGLREAKPTYIPAYPIMYVLSYGNAPSRHYSDFIMSTMASQITSLTVVYSTVYSGADQRKHQSSASLAFVRGIHRRPVNSPHKGPVTRKMVPFMTSSWSVSNAESVITSVPSWRFPHYYPIVGGIYRWLVDTLTKYR